MVGKPKSAEMHPGPGFRIRTEIERPSAETVAAFHAFDTPSISDMMNRLYTMKPTIQPGDVVVVDTSASTMTAVLGDLISTKARHRGAAGFLVDGLIRDLPGIRALGDFPVFGQGVTPIGPLHRGPGEINYPIAAGGIVVNPGDLIVGDANGAVVVPLDIVDDLLQRLTERAAAESSYTSAVARGEFNNAWVDALLRENGVVGIEEPAEIA
jgi:regulator of RNase E activity RraA